MLEQLDPISGIPGTNPGGILSLWLARVEWIQSIPSHSNQVIGRAINFLPGNYWNPIYMSPQSGKIGMKPKSGKAGPFLQVQIIANVPMFRPEVSNLLLKMKGGKYLALVEDVNYRIQLVGTLETPLRILSGGDSGDRGTSRNGYELRLSAQIEDFPPFYVAQIITDPSLQGI